MAYVRHLRITASGTLGPIATPSEIWACNLSMGDPGDPFLIRQDMQALAQTFFPRFNTFFGQCSTGQLVLSQVRVASVGVDGLVGRDANGAYIQGDSTQAPAQSGGSGSKPFQVAWVMSLQSQFEGGVGRGRFYVPVPVAEPGNDGRVLTATVAAQATRLKTLIEGLNTDAATGGYGVRVVVASQGSILKGIPPANRPVTSVSVGDVLDTQRRRRNSLDEARQSASIA